MKPQTVLLSTAYLPPVEYFYYLATASRVVVEQFETYPKQTYRNRCSILSGNGKLDLSVPVTKPQGNPTLTRDVLLFEGDNWAVRHWRAIRAAYSASPFLLYYADELEGFFLNRRPRKLLDFNLELTRTLCRLLEIDAKIELTQEFEKSPENCIDLRTAISPKRPSTLKSFPAYIQVFSDRFPFHPNLSILDLLFNLGPESRSYLQKLG